MVQTDAKVELEKKIMHKLFGDYVTIAPDKFVDLYMPNIDLPEKVTCAISGKETWTSLSNAGVYADQTVVEAESAKHGWLYKPEDITSLEQLNDLVKRADYLQAGRSFDSHDVYMSDDIGSSHDVFLSKNVINSSYISSCSWIWDSEYLFGCRRSGASTYCIGMTEGVNCSLSYQIFSSHKISRSMFIKNSYDLYECLFCGHLQAKKYCIANMQYTEDEYNQLKARIMSWLFKK